MEKRRKSTIISVLAVAFCFLLISLAWAQLTGSDKAWIKRKLPNTLRRVSLPIWGITQAGTGLSLKYQDHAPNPRFAIYDFNGDNAGGAAFYVEDIVLDKETGLVWARDASLAGSVGYWDSAISYCRDLALGNRKGWRLPTIEELSSLVDPSQSNPALPSGHPFVNVIIDTWRYWSSTTWWMDNQWAWIVDMADGNVFRNHKTSHQNAWWPVRGGSGYATE